MNKGANDGAPITLVIVEVLLPEGERYFAMFDVRTGEKVAPWSDSDTSEGVMDALRCGGAA